MRCGQCKPHLKYLVGVADEIGREGVVLVVIHLHLLVLLN